MCTHTTIGTALAAFISHITFYPDNQYKGQDSGNCRISIIEPITSNAPIIIAEAMSSTAVLFTPLEVGSITVRNHISMSALTRNRA